MITYSGLKLLTDELWLPMERVAAQYRALLPTDREPTEDEIQRAFCDAYRAVLSSMLSGAA
ncbi:MAG TPA: hypothetical protein PKD09_09375 [Aggregatilinea sp.]|uniref:hypothetical protein n=1 Tax=Aggregatilinea sp. TaxID=2806333 RepID=UPI002BBF6C1E|nr:hypothetical protein [Aggregatilinea sp.]HML21847.1 hypothetical protein [Aggregatilinea sp.]